MARTRAASKKTSRRRKTTGRKKKGGFTYKKRSKEQVNKRANQNSGLFDSTVRDKFTTFKQNDGKNAVRILPPTWDDAEHYGYDAYVHYNVGADNQAYLCLDKNPGGGGGCPICKEVSRAVRAGEGEYAKDLKPKKRVVCWAIDRRNEDAGPVVWQMPWTLDRDINGVAQEEDTGEVIALDHPDEGFDVSYKKEGVKKQTNYGAIKLARRSSPIADDEETYDEWLQFILANPIPTVLNFYEAEYITGIFEGGGTSEDDDDFEEDDDEDDDIEIDADDEDDNESDEDDDESDEDDDDADLDDEDDEDDDESDEDDEDDEDDDEDDDDESEFGVGQIVIVAGEDDDEDWEGAITEIYDDGTADVEAEDGDAYNVSLDSLTEADE